MKWTPAYLTVLFSLFLVACNPEGTGNSAINNNDVAQDDNIEDELVGFDVVTVINPTSNTLLYAIGSEAEKFTWSDMAEYENIDLSGQVIRVAGPFLNADVDRFVSVLRYFAHATNATVQYETATAFETVAQQVAGTEDAPDVIIFPRLGLVGSLAEADKIYPLSSNIAQALEASYSAGESQVDLLTFKNSSQEPALYGLLYQLGIKSLVWYNPKTFADHQLDVPSSQEELMALTETIAAIEGLKPWLIGLSSGQASGWPGTDWIEDYVIRLQPSAVYSGWITNEVAFDDQRIIEAIQKFGDVVLNSDFVLGNPVTTDFRDTYAMFGESPAVAMIKQGSFIPSFFPEDATYEEDYDFFYFPSFVDAEEILPEGVANKPVMGAGVSLSLGQDSDAARMLIEFFTKPIAHEVWMAQGGFISAHKDAKTAAYPDNFVRNQADILLAADILVFDASDLMPSHIGTDVFWQGVIDYVNGNGSVTAQSFAQSMQQAWD